MMNKKQISSMVKMMWQVLSAQKTCLPVINRVIIRVIHKRKPPGSKYVSNIMPALKLLIDLDLYEIYNSVQHFVQQQNAQCIKRK